MPMVAPIKFMRGAARLPIAVQLWLFVLMMANAVAPLLFIPRMEAWIVLATFLASFLLMSAITAVGGFTRLLGFGHVLWIPLVGYLLVRVGGVPSRDPYQLWMASVIVLNSISLAFDAVDVARFVRGDCTEIVDFD